MCPRFLCPNISQTPLIVAGGATQAEELVRRLHSDGRAVHLVTGGFRQLVEPIAARLNISAELVHANRLLFAADGTYAGFDASEPTARAGGKRVAVAAIKAAAAAASQPCVVVMVGDGATDAEARGPAAADLFVAYGGVVRRPAVGASADWCIADLRTLLNYL